MSTVVTGIQPSGVPHLGNYFRDDRASVGPR